MVTNRDKQLVQQYIDNPNVTYTELGKQFGITRQRAYQILKTHQGYNWDKPKKLYICKGCGISFNGRSGVGGNAVTYCTDCVGKYYNGKLKKPSKASCLECGKKFIAKSNYHQFCSQQCGVNATKTLLKKEKK